MEEYEIKMKIYIVAVILSIAILHGEAGFSSKDVEMITEIHKGCLLTVDLTKEAFDKAVESGDIDNNKMKAHMVCVFKKTGLMNDNGDIVQDAVKKMVYHHVEKDKADVVVANCLVKRSTPEETALGLVECSKCTVYVKK